MTMKPFEPTVKEDLNRPYNVTLTEGQISTILYVLEGYINPSDDYGYDPEFRQDIDSIFGVLEGAVDSYYDGVKKAQEKQPIPEWDETVEDAQENNVPYSTLNEDDYGSKVDALVDSMKEGG